MDTESKEQAHTAPQLKLPEQGLTDAASSGEYTTRAFPAFQIPEHGSPAHVMSLLRLSRTEWLFSHVP